MVAASMADAGTGSRRANADGAGGPDRDPLKLVGLLLALGFVINFAVTMLWHPAGEEDDHPAIFTEYANADGWVLTHFGQFLGVLMALAGLYLLTRFLTVPGRFSALPRLAGFAFIAAGVCYGILQAVDGVALKYATEAWLDASGATQEARFADAEAVRWTEWGVQSYFRLFFGAGLLLTGAAIVIARSIQAWVGWAAIVAGALSIAIAIDVGYAGLASGFQDVAGLALQLAQVALLVGVVLAGYRRGRAAAAG
jgi:hypothetical protein